MSSSCLLAYNIYIFRWLFLRWLFARREEQPKTDAKSCSPVASTVATLQPTAHWPGLQGGGEEDMLPGLLWYF